LKKKNVHSTLRFKVH